MIERELKLLKEEIAILKSQVVSIASIVAGETFIDGSSNGGSSSLEDKLSQLKQVELEQKDLLPYQIFYHIEGEDEGRVDYYDKSELKTGWHLYYPSGCLWVDGDEMTLGTVKNIESSDDSEGDEEEDNQTSKAPFVPLDFISDDNNDIYCHITEKTGVKSVEFTHLSASLYMDSIHEMESEGEEGGEEEDDEDKTQLLYSFLVGRQTDFGYDRRCSSIVSFGGGGGRAKWVDPEAPL